MKTITINVPDDCEVQIVKKGGVRDKAIKHEDVIRDLVNKFRGKSTQIVLEVITTSLLFLDLGELEAVKETTSIIQKMKSIDTIKHILKCLDISGISEEEIEETFSKLKAEKAN